MNTHTKTEWELIQGSAWQNTYRMPVIGGWLVTHSEAGENRDGTTVSQSMTFVPDPNHDWVVEPVITEYCYRCERTVDKGHDCPQKPAEDLLIVNKAGERIDDLPF